MIRIDCSFGAVGFQLAAVSYQLKENQEPASTHFFADRCKLTADR
jgi:hypothetical protein